MAKRILLTTLSKLGKMENSVYYAKGEQEQDKRYCTGVFSSEPGSKFILGTYDIDAIMVVGTEQTYNKGRDKEFYENIKDEEVYNELKQGAFDNRKFNERGMIDKTPSALGMYAFQMAAFLTGKRDYAAYDEEEKNGNELTLRGQEEKLKDSEGGLKKYTIYKKCNGFSDFRKKVWENLELKEEEKKYLLQWYIEKKLDAFSEEDAGQLENIWRGIVAKIQEAKEKNYVLQAIKGKKLLLPTVSNFSEEKTISLTFLPEEKDGQDNINGIVAAIREKARIPDTNQYEDIKLYVDVQGGLRTSIFVRNAVLSILSSQQTNKVTIEEYVAISYVDGEVEHKIDIETKRYRIDMLVSGMNAFLRYGKADLLEEYCNEMVAVGSLTEDSKIHQIVDQMINIDHTLSICDTKNFTEAFRTLSRLLKEKDDTTTGFVEIVFEILKSGIESDYGNLLEGQEVDYFTMIEWCRRKGFIQQALTMIEENMPTEFFRKGILKAEAKLPNDSVYVKIIDENGKNAVVSDALKENVKNLDERSYVERYSKVIVDVLKKNFLERAGETRDKNEDTIAMYASANNVNWMLEHMLQEFAYCTIREMKSEVAYSRLSVSDQRSRLEERNITRLVYNIQCNNEQGRRVKFFDGKNVGLENDADKRALERELDALVEEMRQSTGQSFVEAYCKFRIFLDDYNHGVSRLQLVRAEKFYWRAYERFREQKSVLASILFCLGKGRYKRKAGQREYEVYINLSLHEKIEAASEDVKKKIISVLDKIFLLHEALADERNNSNHASRAMRLDKAIIDRAVETYVGTLKNLLECIENDTLESFKIFEPKKRKDEEENTPELMTEWEMPITESNAVQLEEEDISLWRQLGKIALEMPTEYFKLGILSSNVIDENGKNKRMGKELADFREYMAQEGTYHENRACRIFYDLKAKEVETEEKLISKAGLGKIFGLLNSGKVIDAGVCSTVLEKNAKSKAKKLGLEIGLNTTNAKLSSMTVQIKNLFALHEALKNEYVLWNKAKQVDAELLREAIVKYESMLEEIKKKAEIA